jgi:cytochrome c5
MKMMEKFLLQGTVVFCVGIFINVSNAQKNEPIELAQLSDGFNAEQKYMASCFACHSTGAAGAPKVGPGMAAEWETRLEKGLDSIVENAINGINTMPAKGLCFDCSDDELKAIVGYMIDTSS